MLNNDSIYLDDFWFYENVVNIFNVSDLLVYKNTHTYSIEKNIVVLLIDRIIPDSHPNVFQLSFSIHNLKNDSTVETGITETQIYNSQKETGQTEYYYRYNNWDFLKELEKSGPIGKKEVKKFNLYYKQSCLEFKENSIMTIRFYNL
jgi:hypothetical protein